MPRLLLILLLLAGLHTQAQSLNVGDIPFDPSLDDPNFHLNDSTRVFQYYNSSSWWLDHKDTYRDLFKTASNNSPNPTQNGWLTIRFIINAAGQTGRFRILEMDSNYQSFHFDPRVTRELVSIISQATWQPAHFHGRTYDTYQYITFRFEQGRILDITP